MKASAANSQTAITHLLPYLTLLLWVLPLVLVRSSQQSLMAHDEGIYATQAKTILQTGDWITPQWGEGASFDRTIGIQWLIALCFQLFGISDDVARLPSAIAFCLSVWLVYAIGSQLLNRRLAYLGATIFSITPISLQYARLATQDSVLVFLELLGVWALLKGSREAKPEDPKTVEQSVDLASPSPIWAILAGATFGWAFLIKGFMVIPAALAVVPYLVMAQKWHRHLTNPWLYGGLSVGALPVVGWLGAAIAKYGQTPIVELFGKLFYLKATTNHGAGPFYYYWNIPANGFPWVFFAIIGICLALFHPDWRQQLKSRHAHWLLIGFPITLLIELTLFSTRTHYYPLQLLPYVGLLAAIAIAHLLKLYRSHQQTQLLSGLSYCLGSLALLLILASFAVTAGLLPPISGLAPQTLSAITFVALALGIGWLIPAVTWRRRPLAHLVLKGQQGDLTKSSQQWLSGLLIAPWAALMMLGLTGLWGNYAPELKAFLQTPTVQAVLSQPIDFVVQEEQLGQGDRKTYLLLTFYTPQVGQLISQVAALPPASYAWVDPNLAVKPSQRYQVMGTVKQWQLIRVME
jgi:4-amino-4-deoxy-L-arabinose transferase-like glycosyltransferase